MVCDTIPHMNTPEISFNTPKNLADYAGQFVVFFSEDVEPTVLNSSFIADEAYKSAQEIKEREGREPVVFRVQENLKSNVSQVLATRF